MQHKDDLTWLKFNTEPWSTVLEKWNKTYDLRRPFQNQIETVNDFIKEWPVLSDLRAEALVRYHYYYYSLNK